MFFFQLDLFQNKNICFSRKMIRIPQPGFEPRTSPKWTGMPTSELRQIGSTTASISSHMIWDNYTREDWLHSVTFQYLFIHELKHATLVDEVQQVSNSLSIMWKDNLFNLNCFLTQMLSQFMHPLCDDYINHPEGPNGSLITARPPPPSPFPQNRIIPTHQPINRSLGSSWKNYSFFSRKLNNPGSDETYITLNGNNLASPGSKYHPFWINEQIKHQKPTNKQGSNLTYDVRPDGDCNDGLGGVEGGSMGLEGLEATANVPQVQMLHRRPPRHLGRYLRSLSSSPPPPRRGSAASPSPPLSFSFVEAKTLAGSIEEGQFSNTPPRIEGDRSEISVCPVGGRGGTGRRSNDGFR